ncbi:laminin subunit alpha-3 isoform X2 [Festucalex cinctus]
MQFVDMRGWRLESSDRREVPSVLNVASNTLVADVQELPPSIQALHWVAPASYQDNRECAPGFFRHGSGPYPGHCVRCNCNGLADRCEDWTGRCLNCQYNTAGDRCEYCREGYYGNPAQRSCQVCPCPLGTASNSFAVACRQIDGDFQCICRTGYTGDKCEKCAPGFFGDPLVPGGSCRPCNCIGNENTCDPRTGVCKGTLEPGDTNTDERCQECDNCAQTLLQDLEKLDYVLVRIKTQLDNASAGASSQDRLRKLERAVSDTKNLVIKFRTSVNGQSSRVKQLEDDMLTLTDDITALQDKADMTAMDADKAVLGVEKTHKRAQDLDREIQNMLQKIQGLLDQLKDTDSAGTQPSESVAKMVEQAQRMVKEMEDRNFTPQKTAADKERDEARKLLDYIKNDMSKQLDQNEGSAAKLKEHLKDYDAKLKELDESLKDAKNLVKKANVQNGLNAQALPELLNRINNLKKERKTVKDQVTMAANELKKIEDLLKGLSNNKTAYEKLAAELVSGKTGLTKKVNELSKVAAKEDLVVAAEDHANNLKKLSKELEDAVKTASDRPEVRNANDAINAYKNITDAVKAAEAAANQAKQAADNALNNVKKQKLAERARDLNENGADQVENAQEAKSMLDDAANEIPDITRRLNNAERKKTELEADLRDAQQQLDDIRRDDISGTIDAAKRKAAAANNSASDTMQKLDAIKKEMDKFNFSPGDSSLGGVLDDVDQTVKNLLNTIPTLSDKITEVETLTSQFAPLKNITDNVKKLKELINQARDAANRIPIPMKFTGNGHVQLHPPKNLEDLKAFTDLSLSLQRPEARGDGRRRRRQAADKGDMFVMYLGNKDPSKNYIGMVLRNNVLYGVYKLNGVEHMMKTDSITTSPSEPAKFDKVNLHRIYQDAQLSLTKDITSDPPGSTIVDSKRADQAKNLLDITRDDLVFYVGGYPSNFTPPVALNYPMYKGCIEMAYLNHKVASLYNFKHKENINVETPCKRYASPLGFFFQGTGYGRVNIERQALFYRVDISILTHAENGLLFYIGSEDNYFTVTMEKGVVHLHSNLLSEPATNNLKTFPTRDWVNIVIIISKGKFAVHIANKEVAKAQAQFTAAEFKEYYIGGAPLEMREKHNITMQPFKGCLNSVKLDQNFKLIDEEVGISRGCPKESLTSRKAEFMPGSSLSADLPDFSLTGDVSVSLGFRSTDNDGILLQSKKAANLIHLALQNGNVVVFFDKMWISNKKYNDGQWHYLTVFRKDGRAAMLIDDDDSGVELNGSVSMQDTGVNVNLGRGHFKGCISNLYTRRPGHMYKPEDFTDFKSYRDVLVDVCTPDSPSNR